MHYTKYGKCYKINVLKDDFREEDLLLNPYNNLIEPIGLNNAFFFITSLC